MKKRQSAFIFLALWLILVSGSMIMSRRIDLEFFLILGLMGLLFVNQLLEQNFIQPNYKKYIKYNFIFCIIIFAIIVAHKVMVIVADIKQW